MIAISTFRPDADGEYRQNQIAAKQSWEQVFYTIFYFNVPEPCMEGEDVLFCNPNHSIKLMSEWASAHNGWGVLLNADIVLLPKFKQVITELDMKNGICAISRRWQFEHGKKEQIPAVVDMGLDIFCAIPSVWEEAARQVPKEYRMGKQQWDSWMLQFFMHNYPNQTYDFTASQCVLHPKHDGRREQQLETPVTDPYLKLFRWPSKMIKV